MNFKNKKTVKYFTGLISICVEKSTTKIVAKLDINFVIMIMSNLNYDSQMMIMSNLKCDLHSTMFDVFQLREFCFEVLL